MQEQLHDDDVPVGRVLTRRDALLLLGGLGAGGLLWLAGCSDTATASTSDTGDGGQLTRLRKATGRGAGRGYALALVGLHLSKCKITILS